MKRLGVAFAAGIVFAIGLGISGMTDPGKVIAFLDIAGDWDPSLAFVMAGAIAVHAVAVQWAKRTSRPLWADAFKWPTKHELDARLLGGAALFGLGWGAAGFCPGPAIVALASLGRAPLVFFAAMAVGIAIFQWAPTVRDWARPRGRRATAE